MKLILIFIFYIFLKLNLNGQSTYSEWLSSFREMPPCLVVTEKQSSNNKLDTNFYISNDNSLLKFFFEDFQELFAMDTLLLLYKENNIHIEESRIFIIKNNLIRIYGIDRNGWILQKSYSSAFAKIQIFEQCFCKTQCLNANHREEWVIGDKPIIWSKFVNRKVTISFLGLCESCLDELLK
jgi:hypothetical protein